jgi:outer membrane protein TolC
MHARTIFHTTAAVLITATTASAQAGPAPQAMLPPGAGRTIELKLDDAVRRAVEHNPDLTVVRLSVDADATRVTATRSAFQPVFTSLFGRSAVAAAPSSFSDVTEPVNTNEWFSSTGLRQRLFGGGGTWSVAWDASRTSTNNPFVSFDPTIQSGLLLAFSQPLFKDRKIDTARHQYEIARRNQGNSDLRFREAVVQTVAAVKQAYWTLKASRANVTVNQRSLELAEDLVRQNRARVGVGQAPPLDLVQAEAEVAQRRESLIRADAAARDAEDRLRRLIMDPNDTSFWRTRLEPVDEPAGAAAPPDVDAAIAAALEDRYDLARARQDRETADTNAAFFANQKLPDVRLEASYRGGGIGGTELLRSGTFPGLVTSGVDRGFGNVLGQLFTHDFPTWSVGVTVSYPIGRSADEANLARAEIERRQATHRIASLQLQIAETIRQSGRQVQSTAERVEAARAGEGLAEQRYGVEQRRFEAGLSTTFLVTQAQRDLLQAQVNLLQATLDHQSAIVTFEAVQLAAPVGTGEALGLRGAEVIVVPPPGPLGLFRQGGE